MDYLRSCFLNNEFFLDPYIYQIMFKSMYLRIHILMMRCGMYNLLVLLAETIGRFSLYDVILECILKLTFLLLSIIGYGFN